MPNWCETTYKCVGKTEEITSLYETLQTIYESTKSRIVNGFGRMWLGNVIDALGGEWENYPCRGEITDFYMDDMILVICQDTAWCEQEGFRHFLQTKYPNIRVYFIEEEPGCDVYYTNDETGDFFPERYLIETDEQRDYYTQLKDVANFVTKLTGQEVNTKEEIDKALDTYNEKYEAKDKFAFLNEFKYVVD